MSFIFRQGTIEDCSSVHALISNMEHTMLPYDLFCNIYTNQINNTNYTCIVCEHENKVIGVVNLRFEMQLHHTDKIAEIMEFSVDEAYRGNGIGKKMLALAQEAAKSEGCMQIEVACNQLRMDTHRFYEREGMHNFHFKFSRPLDGNDAYENSIGH